MDEVAFYLQKEEDNFSNIRATVKKVKRPLTA